MNPRRLTPRSSGAPTAGHQARSGGTRYIFASPGLASCRCRPLSSNVRQHKVRIVRPHGREQAATKRLRRGDGRRDLKLTRHEVTRRTVAGNKSQELSNEGRAQNPPPKASHESLSVSAETAVRNFENTHAEVGWGRKPMLEVRSQCHQSQAAIHEQQLWLVTRPQQKRRRQVFSSGLSHGIA